MRITAIAAAAIISAGVVAAPHTTDITAPYLPPAIQTHALAVDLTAVAFTTNTEVTPPRRSTAASAHANVTGQQLQGAVTLIAATAALAALTPVWYAAFPMTIPASIGVAVLFDAAVHILGGSLNQPEALTVLGLGVAGWAVGPIYLVSQAAAVTGKYLSSLASPSATPTTAASSRILRSTSQSHPAKRGFAGSQRNAGMTAAAKPAPSSHRIATAPRTSEQKTRATAGSARSGKKP
ncbi:hypothetical protein CRM90_11195 [Mycobacterium sp. ENV421]|nr:hypothetical protein CRM90_11195 [Mycobacterium sp. ENV421]